MNQHIEFRFILGIILHFFESQFTGNDQSEKIQFSGLKHCKHVCQRIFSKISRRSKVYSSPLGLLGA